jgi:hypothetical protein
MKKFTTCLLIASSALLFIATGAQAQVTISGTVTLVDYDKNKKDLTFEPLPSGSVNAFYYNGTEYSPAGSPAASGIFSYDLDVDPGTKIGFLVTGPAGDASVIATNCPFITVGNFDREDLHLEIYGKDLIDYIIAHSDITDQETTAIILGRVDWVESLPQIGIFGINEIKELATGLENDYPDRLFWWVKESGNQGLNLPQNLEVELYPGGNVSYQNSEVRAYPYLTTAPSPDLYQVSFARPIIGIEVSGTVFSGTEVDDEQPLASGCVSVRDKNEDLVRNSDEIGAADAGAFSLIAPWAEDIFLQVRGPAGGDFTWITYPFFSTGLNVEDVELQVIEKDLVEGVLATFNTTFDLDLGEEDYGSIGLIGGVVERIIYKQDGNDYEDAEGVTISITDTNSQEVGYKILYMNASGEFVVGTETVDTGTFVILINDEDVTFPLDVKFQATSSAEAFQCLQVVEARVYAYAEKADRMISFAPIIVDYAVDEGDVLLDDGGGGGCFIGTANSRR